MIIAASSACQFDHDSVAPGYYGSEQAGSRGASNGVAAQRTGGTQVSGVLQAGGAALKPVASQTGMAGNGGSSTGPGATGLSGATRASCDLSGRWLSMLHYVTDALGQLQVAHSYIYYEIEQKGDALVVNKGLQCGDDAVGSGAFAVTADFHASWAATASKVSYKGRTGSSAATSAGCRIEFQKWYTVRGATLPYYLDPSTTLPTADQKGTGTTPGWEDWDGDGKPGVTGTVSGAVSGKIFVAPRAWTSISGTVPDVSSVFKVPLQWDQDANVMSYDGTPLLSSSAARAANMTLHFAQFARLAPNQATGDDIAICKSITALAPMLTPEAAGL
jgi:hypothetical protein